MTAALGRYRVLKHLTSGGMADVLLGRTDGIEGFERHVVLKRIRPEHARDQRFISMFINEARLAAGLHHQSIVQVFDIGEANGEYFFAMEYIHGEDVRKLLSSVARARTHVPLNFVCAIVSAAASALHYAHDRRDARGRPLHIVHRDVSPSNILIGYDGAVKVVDFGIAKASVRQSETAAGSLNGKCSYMSPEQCNGKSVDRRSDVYGLGVLLYELATTSRLFKGDNEYLVMDAIVNGRFALPQVRRPELPNELASIIMRALAVDPKRRYQTAEELRSELDDFAARTYATATAATLAGYMKKTFGVRPEPWLDLTSEPETTIPGESWSDSARDDGASRDSRRSHNLLPRPATAAAAAPRAATADTVSTQRFGWEAARRMQAAQASKLRWLAVPLVALAGFGVWKLALHRGDAPHETTPQNVAATSVAASSDAPATQPAAPARVVEAPPVQEVAAIPAPVVPAAAAPEHSALTATAPIIEPPRDRPDDVTKQYKKPPRATDKIASAPAAPPPRSAKPAGTTPPSVTPTATAAAASPVALAPQSAVAAAPPSQAPASPAPVAPAVTLVAAPPKEIEPPVIPTLSNVTVSAVASDHAAQLAKCERGTKLNGDVAVSFQINGAGKVVKSQLSSTIRNPKVAGCILRVVQTWKFARPPAGVAKGVYRISYQ